MDERNHEDLVQQFTDLTGASATAATQYLTANRWDLGGAAAEYFTALEEGTTGAQEDGGEETYRELEPYSGPRTLDGRPAPASIPKVSSSSRGTALTNKRGGIATLGSLNQGGPTGAGHGHAHDDYDDDDDEDFNPDEEPRDLFAGGEKSGLAVQDPSQNRNDPRKVVNDILKKARANAARPGGEPSSSARTKFLGSGQTLGGDNTPSQVIPDPDPPTPETGPTQTRILHLWEDGFSIEDGPLRRFDDPQNDSDLQMIRQGRAPLHLMGVRPDQPVDVQLIKHDAKYKPPPKVYKPFSGTGNRLGSPVPGGSSPAAAEAPGLAPVAPTAPASVPDFDLDPSQPTINLRIQLATGARLPARFNPGHTIGHIYNFINNASSESNTRPWVLATTFPNKDHTDKGLKLGEVAEFKKGGTAVQKWT